MRSSSTAGALVAALALVACQSQPQPVSGRSAEPATPAAPAASVAPASTASAKTMAVTTPAPSDPAKLDDAQIAAVLAAYNGGEVDRADVAQDHATSADVKAFAAKAKREHTSMRDDDQAAFAKEKVTASNSPVSERMESHDKTETESLKTKSGASFDEVYMRDEVKAEESAAVLIDRMLDSARDTDVRDRLNKDHSRVEDELTDALRLQRASHKGVTNMQGKGD